MPHKLRIGDPVGLVNNIARLYQSVTRILMEYVDNSLDDAEELYLAAGGRYPRDIFIRVRIDTKNRRVAVVDNCRGMKRRDLLRIVTGIADSDKKAQPWTHGQFGFGVHAFRACCSDLEITTRSRSDRTYRIAINRESKVIGDEKVPDRDLLSGRTGTAVVLSNFDADWWKEVNLESIREEIEKHFDLLLARPGLTVTVDTGGFPERCEPFDYSGVPGEEFARTIPGLDARGRTSLFSFDRPIEVYLKVTEKPFAGRNPVFFEQGRRIEEIQSIKSYRNKSKYRTGLWAHPHLIGYVELQGTLKPVLSRDDFQRSETRTAFYRHLSSLEDEVHELVRKRDSAAEEAGFGRLESVLSRLVSRLAREDALSFRKGFLPGGDVPVAAGASPEAAPAGEAPVPGVEQDGKDLEGDGSGGSLEERDEGETAGRPRKKSGFDIKFSPLPLELIMNEDTGEATRSSFADGTIVIYMEHPDFQERIERTRTGRIKLGTRLATYISSIVATYYKDSFYEKYKFQPDVRHKLDSRVEMFDDHLGFVCRFDDMLQGFVGKDICSLEASGEAVEAGETGEG